MICSVPSVVLSHILARTTASNCVATMPKRIAYHVDAATARVGVADAPSSQPGVGNGSQRLTNPRTTGASEEPSCLWLATQAGSWQRCLVQRVSRKTGRFQGRPTSDRSLPRVGSTKPKHTTLGHPGAPGNSNSMTRNTLTGSVRLNMRLGVMMIRPFDVLALSLRVSLPMSQQ